MSRRGLEHDPPDRTVAGVEDVVEALGEQGGRLGHRALDDMHRLRVEVLRQQAGEDGRRRRRHLARLDHRCVASRQHTHEGREGEQHRVVPRRDDEHDTQRLPHDLRRARQHPERHRDPARRQPPAQVLQGVVDLAHDQARLGEPGLDGALAEVGRQRPRDLVLVVDHEAAQRPQLGLAPGIRLGASAVEGPSSARHDPCHVGGGGGRAGAGLGHRIPLSPRGSQAARSRCTTVSASRRPRRVSATRPRATADGPSTRPSAMRPATALRPGARRSSTGSPSTRRVPSSTRSS